jgi:flagellar motor switch protein FliM
MADLTPEEIDALTKDGADGPMPAAAGPGAVSTLDLARPERSLRGELPGLDLVLERFARGLPAALRACLGAAPDAAVTEVELVRFARVVETLARPASLQLLRLAPLRGHALLVVPAPLAAAALEVAFGGSRGRQTPLEGREPSAIELRALERLGARVVQELVAAWRPVAALEGAVVRSETDPAYAGVGPGELVVQVAVRLGLDGVELGLALCVPWAALDPVRARLGAGPGREAAAVAEGAWSEPLRALLGETELELTAELGRRRLSVRQVLALRVGDVLPLGTGREGPVVVRVEGRPRFLGAPGVSGTQHAVQLTARL